MYLLILRSILLVTFLSSSINSQNNFVPEDDRSETFGIFRFYDSSHHWYDINDDHQIISALPEKPKYKKDEITKIADNILLFQKSIGGWPKNYDMQAILTDDQKKAVLAKKDETDITFDNGATHSQLTYLAEVYTETKIEKYLHAFNLGLDFVLEAQYENGGWPQCYPDTSGYRKHITYNDGAMIGIMDMLDKIVNRDPNYLFVNDKLYNKIKDSYDRGIECILNTQIVEDGKLLVWSQQHDNTTLKPQNARTYELASICNDESAEILKFLMKIKNPKPEIIKSIKRGIEWFEKSQIDGIKVEIIDAPKKEYKYRTSSIDKVVIEDSNAPRIWARFNELNTHRPFFCNRDGKVVYSLSEVLRERRSGYRWYTYAPEETIKLFNEWPHK